MFDNFTKIPFTTNNLDRYFIRTSILKAINESKPILKGKLLDLGCGQMPYRDYIKGNCLVNEYIGVDIPTALIYDENVKPDFVWDGLSLPFKDNEFDSILITEVLEHLPDPNLTLKEAFRVLKNEGSVIFTVPFIWPLHEVPHDEYRYTPFSLKRIFDEAGFSNIKILPTGGWHASMAQMLGLWVRRSSMSKRKRFIFSILIKPVMKLLIKNDKNPVEFIESQMISGLYGSAQKIN